MECSAFTSNCSTATVILAGACTTYVRQCLRCLTFWIVPRHLILVLFPSLTFLYLVIRLLSKKLGWARSFLDVRARAKDHTVPQSRNWPEAIGIFFLIEIDLDQAAVCQSCLISPSLTGLMASITLLQYSVLRTAICAALGSGQAPALYLLFHLHISRSPISSVRGPAPQIISKHLDVMILGLSELPVGFAACRCRYRDGPALTSVR
jgi:hypothetical protein